MSANGYDVETIRRDFPILSREVYGKPLVYLDNGASAQKPQAVIDAVTKAYSNEYANVHRGLHYLSNTATDNYEAARESVRKFLNAGSVDEVIFTRSTTEAINLVAYSLGLDEIGEGDEIVLSILEHHSNIVPWHFLRERKGAVLKWAPVHDDGAFDFEAFEALLTERTKLVAITHMSNVLGTVVPVADVIRAAHARGIKVLVDGSQAAVHMPVDVRTLDADFYCFTGHKVYGPSGIGVLYGKRDLLEEMPPFMGGGDMIRSVTMTESRWNTLPYKFEAGTPAIAEVIGLGAAVDFLTNVGMGWIHAHEQMLTRYAYERLSQVEGLRILGPEPEKRGGLIAFTLGDIHPHDISAVLDMDGIAIRAGHHCAQPVHDCYNIAASARASFYLYNTTEDVDLLAESLEKAHKLFG